MCKLCNQIKLSKSFVLNFTLKCSCGKELSLSRRVTHDLRIEDYHYFQIDEPVTCECGVTTPYVCLPCEGDLLGGLFGKEVIVGEDIPS